MPRTIATIDAELELACDTLRAGTPGEMVEIRLDAMWPTAPDEATATQTFARLLEAAQQPLLATLRPVRQGGRFEGNEQIRIGLLDAALRVGFAAIDLENDLDAMAPLMAHLAKQPGDVALSNHLANTPDTGLGERHLSAMQDLGGAWHKLAFPAPAFAAQLRSLELAHLHRKRNGRPAVHGVGGDSWHRAAEWLAGNTTTYGAASPDVAAPQQPPLQAILDVIKHWGLDPETLDARHHSHWYAVLGDPVAHSLSPRIHNAALKAANIPAHYGAVRVPAQPGMLHLLTTVGPRLGLMGCSVTAPHKRDLVACAAPDERAAAIGAANTLYGVDGQPHCTNTDALAMQEALPKGDTAVVLGAGGMARAATWALREAGYDVCVQARDATQSADVAHHFGVQSAPWNSAAPCDVLVQTTSAPAQETLWHGATPGTLIEARYGEPTALEQACTGAKLVDGRTLLVAQGAHAFAIWTGKTADRDAMRQALEQPCAPTPPSVS